MAFWSDISNLTGMTLKTLGHGKVFDVIDVDDRQVIVKPHATNVERAISRKDFQGAYDEMSQRGTIDLAGIRRFSEMHPVYVAAMLAQLPYIASVHKPKISLKFSPKTLHSCLSGPPNH